MQKNNKIKIAIAAAVFLLIIVCLVYSLILSDKKKKPKDSTDENETVIVAPPVNNIDGLTITSEANSTSYKYCGETILTYDINCPVFSSDQFETEKINKVLCDYCQKFASISNEAKLNAEDEYDWSVKNGLKFEVIENNADYSCYRHENTLSVTFDINRSGTKFEKKSFCFDLTNGKQIALNEYFNVSSDEMISKVKKLFEQKIDEFPEDFDPDAKELLQDEIDLNNFYLSDDGITVFLPECTISPRAFGMQYVLIEY